MTPTGGAGVEEEDKVEWWSGVGGWRGEITNSTQRSNWIPRRGKNRN